METEKNWTYYSSLVPGYVEKHSLRGIRDRNKALLKQLKKTRSKAKEKEICDLLVENNRPLAMYMAHRHGLNNGLTSEQIQDAYQECCVELATKTGKIRNEKLYSPSLFQTALSLCMRARLNNLDNKAIIENKETPVPFDEQTFPAEKEKTIDREYLRRYILHMPLPERDVRIVIEYYLGDEEKYGDMQPGLELISFHYDISKERVRQILLKTTKKIKKITEYYVRKGKVHIEDFFSDTTNIS